MSHHHHALHHPHRNRVGRLARWQRISTHGVLGICALSGLIYFLRHGLHWPAGEFSDRSFLVIHGISAALALMAFGAVLPHHVRTAWSARRNRGSGVAMLLVMGLLMLSGLGLYYGSEEMHELVLWSHWVLGGLAFLALPVHLVLGIRNHRRLSAARPRLCEARA